MSDNVMEDTNEMQNTLFQNDLEEISLLSSRLSIPKRIAKECVDDIFRNEIKSKALLKTQSFSTFLILRRFLISSCKVLLNILKRTFTCLFVIIVVYLFFTSHNGIQKLLMRNSQGYIYPIMRSLRHWTLPIIRKYDTLSDWHEEECLLKNPFYHESPLDCWPCEDVRTLVDLTGLTNYSSAYVYNEQPFIVRDSFNTLFTLKDLFNLYRKHSIALDRGTAKFSCNENGFHSLRDLLTKDILPERRSTLQVMWKINRVAAARVIRKSFPRPYFVPNNSEVALERYLYLSGADTSQFFLPLTDFANVWIAQSQGHRLIVLDPSFPCATNCSTVSVLLRPHDVLYYNWQFWRPRSLPSRLSEEISITYVGSFY